MVNWRKEPLNCLWRFLCPCGTLTSFCSFLCFPLHRLWWVHPEPFPILLKIHIPKLFGPLSANVFVETHKFCLLNVCCLNEVICLPGATFRAWAWQKHGVPLHKNLASRTVPVLKFYCLSCLASTSPFCLSNNWFVWAAGLYFTMDWVWEVPGHRNQHGWLLYVTLTTCACVSFLWPVFLL